MQLMEIRGLGTVDKEVAIDLDGVLADFDAKVEEIFGTSIDNIPKNKLWSKISYYSKNVEPFFETLPMMNDAKKLVDFVDQNFKKWFILTASGYTPKDAAEQKKRWVAKAISPRVDVVVVRKSNEKADHAHEDAILIDDRKKSIDPWRAAGGMGILHVTADQTVRELQQVIANLKDGAE